MIDNIKCVENNKENFIAKGIGFPRIEIERNEYLFMKEKGNKIIGEVIYPTYEAKVLMDRIIKKICKGTEIFTTDKIVMKIDKDICDIYVSILKSFTLSENFQYSIEKLLESAIISIQFIRGNITIDIVELNSCHKVNYEKIKHESIETEDEMKFTAMNQE